MLAWLAGFSATALMVVPKGLAVFAVLLVLASVCALPDAGAVKGERVPRAIGVLLCAALAAVSVAALSTWRSGAGLPALDHPARALLLPWCAWLAWATRAGTGGMWHGALLGVGLALVLSATQAWMGAGRAGGQANPIVFANVVLVLLCVVVFCRPPHARVATMWLLAGTVAMAIASITLSGSRGVLPGLGLILLAWLGAARGHRMRRIGLAVAVSAAVAFALWHVPWLSTQFRFDQVHADVSGYAVGEMDRPISARMGLLTVAWDAYREAPWLGVGIDAFPARVDASAYCSDGARHFCQLEHAHNDLAQWGATMGTLGVAALLALYLGPWVIAVQLARKHTASGTGPAWAAAMLVLVCLVSGITQSMFAHAVSASVYAAIAGLLLGSALRDDRLRGGNDSSC